MSSDRSWPPRRTRFLYRWDRCLTCARCLPTVRKLFGWPAAQHQTQSASEGRGEDGWPRCRLRRAWDRLGQEYLQRCRTGNGAVVLRRRMTREGLMACASKLATCTVVMEACCGAHFLGRTFASQGHTVRLMSPEYVQPSVKSQKTDHRDAEAIAEAATGPTMN